MKYALLVIAALTLAGCIEDGKDATTDMIIVCLDGVEYWVDGENTQQQMMAPRIDPETLSFVRCEAIN